MNPARTAARTFDLQWSVAPTKVPRGFIADETVSRMRSKVNAANAHIRPPEGTPALDHYFSAVERALGVRSDAELARVLGLPPSTVGTWKRRGAVPADRMAWFTEDMVPLIARRWTELPQATRTARAAVVELIARSKGDPLRADQFVMTTTAMSLGGLLALAEFLATLDGVPSHVLSSSEVERIADFMEGLMPQFRLGAGVAGD